RWPSAYKVSNTRLDLPEPLGPVTTVSSPVRISRSRSLRLCCRAPRMRICPWVMERSFGGEAKHSREQATGLLPYLDYPCKVRSGSAGHRLRLGAYSSHARICH